jgi:hypothetical protein
MDFSIVTEGILVGILKVDKCCFQALAFPRHAGHVTESATMDIVDADDVCVVTEGLRNRGGCGRTRSKGKSICTPGFKR